MPTIDNTYYCKTCNRTMDQQQFYMSKRIDKYPPNGKMPECKKCLTRHVDNWDPKTYLWILEEIDVPYIEDEWTTLVERYCQDRSKVTGTTVLGRYLSKMKLKQYRDFSWDDTEELKVRADAIKSKAMARQGFSGEEIEAALESGTMPEKPVGWDEAGAPEAPSSIDMLEPIDFNDDLTEEDRKMLSLKWGKTYRPYEWVQLEQYYQEMMQSFDIQTPSHEDYLKLICKTSLKAHQLIDLGDIEGFQKMSKVYDSLMKSAKFTAVQNKTESGEYVNSISELVYLCEKEEGFIPRFYTDEPKDKVDQTLRDLRGYTNRLVTEEMNLGTLIEGAVKALQRQAEQAEDEDIDDEDLDLIEQAETSLQDSDFEEHYDFLEQQAEEDELLFREILGGEPAVPYKKHGGVYEDLTDLEGRHE